MLRMAWVILWPITGKFYPGTNYVRSRWIVICPYISGEAEMKAKGAHLWKKETLLFANIADGVTKCIRAAKWGLLLTSVIDFSYLSTENVGSSVFPI